MDIFLTAIDNVFTLQNMFFMSIAIFLGIVGGALPGFSATMAVALMVPYTASVASSFGGVIGTVILILFALPLSKVSLSFGSPEFFWMAIFGLTIIASLSEKSILKGFTDGLIGIMLSMIGMAPIGGDIRFNLGLVSLQWGVELVSVLIGFFCIPEVFRMAVNPNQKQMIVDKVRGSKKALLDAWRNVVCHMGNTMRSSVLGAFIAIFPGAGGNIANIVAYNEAKRAAKDPQSFINWKIFTFYFRK